MNLEEIALNIEKHDNGIYYSKSTSDISYPEVGNENCMQIEENSFWFLHRNNIIAESVKKYNGDRTFFDIGGGNGFVSKRLQEEGVKVLLVEPGKMGAMNAYRRGIKNVLCATLEDAAFVPKQIDSVGLFDVVEHIKDDFIFLKKINEYMKDEGLVYITVPAYNFLWSNEDEDAGHFRRYSIPELYTLLDKSGFNVVYSTYIFSVLPLPIFVLRSFPSKIGLNKNSNNIEKHQGEHKPKKGILNSLLQRIWSWELSRVKLNKKIAFGGSCFVIGKKVANKI